MKWHFNSTSELQPSQLALSLTVSMCCAKAPVGVSLFKRVKKKKKKEKKRLSTVLNSGVMQQDWMQVHVIAAAVLLHPIWRNIPVLDKRLWTPYSSATYWLTQCADYSSFKFPRAGGFEGKHQRFSTRCTCIVRFSSALDLSARWRRPVWHVQSIKTTSSFSSFIKNWKIAIFSFCAARQIFHGNSSVWAKFNFIRYQVITGQFCTFPDTNIDTLQL